MRLIQNDSPDRASLIIPRLMDLIQPGQLDSAIDRAAKSVEAVVSQYVATPATSRAGFGAVALEIGVEFFISPQPFGAIAGALHNALADEIPAYAAARRLGQIDLPIVHRVPVGVFHQWRIAWGQSEKSLNANRWGNSRATLKGVLAQAKYGWREWLPS